MLKGKLTTDSDNHSGEGIFFTSRALDKFQEIELDFAGVSEIGQGFAHELFVVFQRKNQTVKITPVNASKEIEKMIKHVKNTTL